MIPTSVLRILGQHIALANSVTFLWRKLAGSMTVQSLSSSQAPEVLQDTLRQVLESETLEEDQYTLAYSLLVALLLRGPVFPVLQTHRKETEYTRPNGRVSDVRYPRGARIHSHQRAVHVCSGDCDDGYAARGEYGAVIGIPTGS